MPRADSPANDCRPATQRLPAGSKAIVRTSSPGTPVVLGLTKLNCGGVCAVTRNAINARNVIAASKVSVRRDFIVQKISPNPVFVIYNGSTMENGFAGLQRML